MLWKWYGKHSVWFWGKAGTRDCTVLSLLEPSTNKLKCWRHEAGGLNVVSGKKDEED